VCALTVWGSFHDAQSSRYEHVISSPSSSRGEIDPQSKNPGLCTTVADLLVAQQSLTDQATTRIKSDSLKIRASLIAGREERHEKII
jgi:hypothetical protein